MFSAWPDQLQFPLPPQQQQTDLNFSDKQMRCVGCGADSTIRVHYGAPSCHGCKAFFRRSVFESRTYECSSRNTCDVTPTYRNRCRSCRFRNCINGGMNAKLVREERFKTGSRSNSERSPTSRNSPKSETEFGMNIKPEPVEEELTLVQFLTELDRRMDMLQDNHDGSAPDEVSHWGRHLFFNLGLQNPQFIIQRVAMNWQCHRIMTSPDMYFGWYRAFVLLADWAMSLPEFRTLPLVDQTTLFKENFSAFAWMTYAYRSYECGNADLGIPLGNGAYIPYRLEQQAMMEPKWAETYGLVGKYVVELVVHPMRELGICFEEYCLLKTIALFQQVPDSRLSPQAVILCGQMRDRLLKALSVVIDMKFPQLTTSQRVMRASRTMLILPSFYNIGRIEAEMIRNMNTIDLNKMSGVPLVILNNYRSPNPF